MRGSASRNRRAQVASSAPAATAKLTAPPLPARKMLTGQKALVTGTNSGIGRGAAVALGQAGADVAVNYVDGDEAADAVVDEIRRSGANAFAESRCFGGRSGRGHVQEHGSAFGTIDILVNNAGLQRDAAFQDMTLADWNTVISVNLTGHSYAPEAIRDSCAAALFRACRGRQGRSSA